MASAQLKMIQNGRPSFFTSPVRCPVVISASAMTPMVFCASLVPCASATSEAVAIWPQRKPSSRRRASTFWVIRYTSQVPHAATMPAITGAATAGIRTFWVTPDQLTPLVPSAASPAPISPPNRACEELDGIPNSQVSRFHRMPPIRPAKMMVKPIEASMPESRWPVLGVLHLQDRRRHRNGDLDGEKRADQVQDAGQQHGSLGLERAGGDRGRHGVAGVVEPVGEVECQRGGNQQHQDDQLPCS